MKEITVYVALIFFEFQGPNAEANCNAFYVNYNSSSVPNCMKIVRTQGDYIEPPLQRPKDLFSD
tara:strand:- start:14227 stop:14418 length:192 start_codon:yes stop_codon:yes gene_type:complete